MEIDTTSFIISTNNTSNFSAINTKAETDLTKETAEIYLQELKLQLFDLQEKLYADNKKSVLILFQAMDAAGKDSAVKHVMSGLNPQGCQVFSFKQPSSEELDHDFLWRHYKALPERGRIGIHNRSHYENVLICKVHPEFAASESQVNIDQIDDKFWKRRYKSIRNFEEHLNASGTVIIKIFLHISKGEQKKRFLERIDDPSKNWKFASGDIIERELWGKYMQAYQDAFEHTSTETAPWQVIPADKKWFARVAICQIIVEALTKMNLTYPTLKPEEIISLKEIKEKLITD